LCLLLKTRTSIFLWDLYHCYTRLSPQCCHLQHQIFSTSTKMGCLFFCFYSSYNCQVLVYGHHFCA